MPHHSFKQEQTIGEMWARREELSRLPVPEPKPTIPYLEVSVQTGDGEIVWKTVDLGPSESMLVEDGNHWLYKAVRNKIEPKTSSTTAYSKRAQAALLKVAWKTETTYRQHTSPNPTLADRDPKNQTDEAEYGSKPFSECWPLPDESDTRHLIYRFHTGDSNPTILTPSFAIIADTRGVTTTQVKGYTPFTHRPSVPSVSGDQTAGTQVPSIFVTEYDD